MSKSASYVISAYFSILSNPQDKILDVGNPVKEGNPIPSFDEELLIELCSNVQTIFQNENNILEISGDLIVVGDIHGSLHDLLRILHYIKENQFKVLFLGDYVDRGNFSLECITLLYALKIIYPDQYFLIRGNHEFDTMCSLYGFKDEIINYHNPKKSKKLFTKKIIESKIKNWNFKDENISDTDESKIFQCEEYFINHKDANCYKYSKKLYDSFICSFNYLPIAAIVNKQTFCIHGGLSPRLSCLKQIEKYIVRPISKFEENYLFTDIVWSDPSSHFSFLYNANPRGRGFLFGPNAVDYFLSNNSLKRIIRGHQCVKLGSLSEFNNKCITVFSASSYSKEMGNNSGIVQLFQNNEQVKFISFKPLIRLQKSDAIYYKVQNFKEKMESNICFSFIHPKLNSNIRIKNLGHRVVLHCSDVINSRKSNLMFITNARKTDVLIQKPLLCYSNSFNNFLSDNNKPQISLTQSMHRINRIFDHSD